ncbi:acyl-CoA thioesterase [Fictibacillus terranigra]|uniref:Thioesterase family protein n=1 Tax=Fictibacillus terranigra TaxID=3058424 RepID=A0ABT8E5E2_9BACL|nr:thioesterase family protein [Fictibacillus sp. CENA-BCM004]MDN4073133.1 thioesterase family protein [Fictibacillus sp. CENA-BCM004]
MHEIELTVRFCETDALGHINNTSYFIYLEEARIRCFESLGLDMNTNEWSFILASTKCDFMAQGYFNDRLLVRTGVCKIGTKSFTLVHEIYKEETEELVARGNAVIVYFDFKKQQTANIPDFLRDALERNQILQPQESET